MSSRNISVSGTSVTLTNEDQILGMGGPGIADILIGTELILKSCIADNFVFNEDLNSLFFVKFTKVSNHQWFFSIWFYNIGTKMLCEFEKTFDMVHLGDFISKNELEIYPAFHSRFENKNKFSILIMKNLTKFHIANK